LADDEVFEHAIVIKIKADEDPLLPHLALLIDSSCHRSRDAAEQNTAKPRKQRVHDGGTEQCCGDTVARDFISVDGAKVAAIACIVRQRRPVLVVASQRIRAHIETSSVPLQSG